MPQDSSNLGWIFKRLLNKFLENKKSIGISRNWRWVYWVIVLYTVSLILLLYALTIGLDYQIQ